MTTGITLFKNIIRPEQCRLEEATIVHEDACKLYEISCVCFGVLAVIGLTISGVYLMITGRIHARVFTATGICASISARLYSHFSRIENTYGDRTHVVRVLNDLANKNLSTILSKYGEDLDKLHRYGFISDRVFITLSELHDRPNRGQGEEDQFKQLQRQWIIAPPPAYVAPQSPATYS